MVVPQVLRDSDEDERAERTFDRTYAYRETCNQPACSIGMPWRHDISLPDPNDAYLMVFGGLLSLERRVGRDEVMKTVDRNHSKTRREGIREKAHAERKGPYRHS